MVKCRYCNFQVTKTAGTRHNEHERVCEERHVAVIELKDKDKEYNFKIELAKVEKRSLMDIIKLYEQKDANSRAIAVAEQTIIDHIREGNNQMVEILLADSAKNCEIVRDTVYSDGDKTRDTIQIATNKLIESIDHISNNLPQMDAHVYDIVWCNKYLLYAKRIPLETARIIELLNEILESDGDFAAILQNPADHDHKYALNFMSRIIGIITTRLNTHGNPKLADVIDRWLYTTINCCENTKRAKIM